MNSVIMTSTSTGTLLMQAWQRHEEPIVILATALMHTIDTKHNLPYWIHLQIKLIIHKKNVKCHILVTKQVSQIAFKFHNYDSIILDENTLTFLEKASKKTNTVPFSHANSRYTHFLWIAKLIQYLHAVFSNLQLSAILYLLNWRAR